MTSGVEAQAVPGTPATPREERLEGWNRMLVQLAKSKALEEGDLTAALQEITEAASRTLEVERASVWIYLPERAGIRCLDLYESGKKSHAAGVELMAESFPGYFRALEEERTIPAEDAHTHPSTAEFSAPYLTPLGIGAMLDAPIRRRGRMVGVICHEHVGGRRPWSFEEQNFAGSLADFVSLAMEAAERRKAERALADRVADLARSNAELEQFAYVASHDLQEPLRMVSSYVALLAKRYKAQLDGDADKWIGYAVEGAKRMHNLINDLLAFSRAGRTDEELRPVDAGAALAAALANLQATLTESSAKVTFDALPAVRGFGSQLVQLFQNLVDNAVKYRREGVTPEVHVSAERRGGEWAFAVRDNGLGIEPRYHERIFRIFQRLHERGRYDGSGIGLAIAKRIVEHHHGKIWVESEPGRGSTFWFTVAAEA
ncbi:MAG TPA: ATP-binding protein [Myxococcota bacterium]|jgi:light-regulated signal transduction histidine kinase (bacteriophytochrome)|nr:ATP-binding protein [Myxococcota bacterium]